MALVWVAGRVGKWAEKGVEGCEGGAGGGEAGIRVEEGAGVIGALEEIGGDGAPFAEEGEMCYG